MRVEITIPNECMPRKVPGLQCECMNRPVDLSKEPFEIKWEAALGSAVSVGDVVCTGEVQKKIVEFCAPCSGVLAEICIEDGSIAAAGDVLGYIESPSE